MTFAEAVAHELARARRKHPTPMRSLHEAYAIILEEFEEFWQEVKRQNVHETAVLSELVQVAAMLQRCAEDCDLVTQLSAIAPTTERT